MTEALAQAGFERVVVGIRNAGDLADGAVNATAGRIGQRASGIEAPLVHVIFGGNRTRVCHRAAGAGRVHTGNVNRRIPFNESRQLHPCRTNVTDLQ